MDKVVALDLQARRHTDKLKRALGGFILEALGDEDVTEVICNPDGRVWVESRRGGMEASERYLSEAQVETVIKFLATHAGGIANEEHPIVECELPLDGSRFEGLLPPVSPRPTFVIRKRAREIFSLPSYVDEGVVSHAQFASLRMALRNKVNILVAGATGSGKTTLVNALIKDAVALGRSSERYLLLEDTYELQCEAENKVHMHSSESVDLLRLTQVSMRMRPDRIIVGEVRGKEAHALIKVWNTGHPGGISTIHAENCLQALRRLELLIEEAGVKAKPELIADTIGLICVIERTAEGRRLRELKKVTAYLERERTYKLDQTV